MEENQLYSTKNQLPYLSTKVIKQNLSKYLTIVRITCNFKTTSKEKVIFI